MNLHQITIAPVFPLWLIRGFGAPEEAVDARKCARLVRGARAWLHAHGLRHARARFDVIWVEPGSGGALELRHLPGAFDAS